MTTEARIPLPKEAPIMVLPGCVLFPGVMLPLKIFEPRYRAMLAWALHRDRMFCIALMKPGIDEAETVDQFHHIAGVGLIRASVTQSDATSNLLLQGIARIRFTDFVQLEPFRIARLEPISSLTGDDHEAAKLSTEVRDRCARFRGEQEEAAEKLIEKLSETDDPELLADFVASAFVRDPFQRQELLEEDDVNARLRMLVHHLRKELESS